MESNMKSDNFNFDIENYKVGKAVEEFVTFPTFFGVSGQEVPFYIHRATKEISPCVVVTACVHGDEINSLRIAQKLIQSKLKITKGTLIIFPLLNIYGFYNKSRYLPDRKDLNRYFPGNENGSFGSRFANFCFKNIAKYGDMYVDLHTGGAGRFNIPQIRIDMKDERLKKMLPNLSIPVAVNSYPGDGSLRGALKNVGKPCIVFEGGEGNRLNTSITNYGVNFVKSVLANQNMLKTKIVLQKETLRLMKTSWMRTSRGGLLINKVKPGKVIKKGEIIGEIRKVTGELLKKVAAPQDSVIIGMTEVSLLMTGDPLYHIGFFREEDFDEEVDFLDFYDIDVDEE
jgi:predicted deacylase